MIFTPIFKTKESAEPIAIEKTCCFFNDNIIPFVEITKQVSSNPKVLKSIHDYRHFEQIYRKQKTKKNEEPFTSIFNRTLKLVGNPNTIIALQVIDRELKTELSSVKKLIDEIHKNNQPVAIRLNSGSDFEKVSEITNKLGKNDYFIIDISEQDYSASLPYIKKVYNTNHKCCILVFCDERPSWLNSDSYKDSGFNAFQTSLVASIKDKTFVGDGFGSYCSAKNDLYEGGNKNSTTHALFLIYDFKNNDFYSIKSKNKDHISRVYSGFKGFIRDKQGEWSQFINDTTPITNQMLLEFLNSEMKGTASKYICIGITHYIEEIIRGIF